MLRVFLTTLTKSSSEKHQSGAVSYQPSGSSITKSGVRTHTKKEKNVTIPHGLYILPKPLRYMPFWTYKTPSQATVPRVCCHGSTILRKKNFFRKKPSKTGRPWIILTKYKIGRYGKIRVSLWTVALHTLRVCVVEKLYSSV